MKPLQNIGILIIILLFLGCNSSNNTLKISDNISFLIPKEMKIVTDRVFDDKHHYKLVTEHADIFIDISKRENNNMYSLNEKDSIIHIIINKYVEAFNAKPNSIETSTKGNITIAFFDYSTSNQSEKLHAYAQACLLKDNNYVHFIFINKEADDNELIEERKIFFKSIIIE